MLSKQLLRIGTAAGALVGEAQNAESPKDFVHKLGTAQKESDETMYWLELLKETYYLTDKGFESINNETLGLLYGSVILWLNWHSYSSFSSVIANREWL